MDNPTKIAPYERISVDITYYKGELDVLCLPDDIHDLIKKNIPEAKSPYEPEEETPCEPSTMKTDQDMFVEEHFSKSEVELLEQCREKQKQRK